MFVLQLLRYLKPKDVSEIHCPRVLKFVTPSLLHSPLPLSYRAQCSL